MRNSRSRRVLDYDDASADWTKSKYDLGISTLNGLAKFVGMEVWEPAFKIWLKQANKYPWVDSAPTEIRLAIRAHADFQPKQR